jgi:hypothetical protein
MTEKKIDLSAGMVPKSQANTSEIPTKPAPPDPKPLGAKSSDRSAMQKGSPVTLPDGSRGKVMHIVENMKTARVRTDDGKNLTVRLSALTVVPHVMVQSHARRIPEK